MARRANRRQNTKREQARVRLSEQLLVHPELEDFLRSPEALVTDVRRVSGGVSLPNDLEYRQGVTYVPAECRKFITTDTTVHQLYRQAYARSLPSFLGAGPRARLAFDPKQIRAAIVVAGGTAPGVEAVIHGVVQRHQVSYGLPVGNLLGFVGGFRGLGRRGEVNTVLLTSHETARRVDEPGCHIGMSRHREDVGRMVETLYDLCLDIVYFVGGDGTLEAAHRVAQEIERRQLRIAVAGIPKTIDNDVPWCWETFGFATAVEQAAVEIRALHANITTHSRVGIIILYGGHSGFLAANAGLASGVADAIVIPEEQPRLDKLVAYTRQLVARRDGLLADHALIVLAEGVAWCGSFREPMVQELRRRGVIRSGEEPESLEELPSDVVRAALVAVLTKAFEDEFQGRHPVVILEPRSLVSAIRPSARDIVYCKRLAANAVDSALAGFTDFMSSFWNTEYVVVPLSQVAGKRKLLPVHGSFWTACQEATGQPTLS